VQEDCRNVAAAGTALTAPRREVIQLQFKHFEWLLVLQSHALLCLVLPKLLGVQMPAGKCGGGENSRHIASTCCMLPPSAVSQVISDRSLVVALVCFIAHTLDAR
jgi:hypothetical protein